MRDPRGSLWNRWDLHVHTPASIKHHYGGDEAEAWDRFLEGVEALPADIKVLGINDYLFLDGYLRVLEERARGRLSNIELVLPVVELRLDKFGGASRNHLSRVNFHVIFSNTVSPDVIQQQFISRLEAEYRLDPERGAYRRSWAGVATRESLRDLGREIISSVPEERQHEYGDPLHEGFSNLNFQLTSVRKALESTYFEGKHLTAVGKTEWEEIQWNDGTIADKKDVINGAHLVFTSAPTVDNCLAGRRKLRDAGVNGRLLDCSDAHAYADSPEKDRLGKCFTWISADTEFEGLIKAVNEYEDRVFLGERPGQLERVSRNRTKYIRRLTIERIDGALPEEPWLDGTSVDLNHGLVAIIGNKGSGKSALLDVMGLLGNSSRHADASFLSQERFRRPGDNKARHFEAEVTWEDGTQVKRGLDEDVAASTPERLTYVPQAAFEKICNELGSGEHGRFDDELKRVIFSHTSPAERLGCETLDELLEYRAAEIHAAIAHRRDELSALNRQILSLERRATPEHLEALTGQLERRRAELAAHDAGKPEEVPEPPGEADPRTQEVLADIRGRQAQLDGTVAELDVEVERFAKIRLEVEVLDRVRQRVDTFVRRHEELRVATAAELEPMGIAVDSIVSLQVDLTVLDVARAEREAQLDAIEHLIGDPLRADRASAVADELDIAMIPLSGDELDELPQHDGARSVSSNEETLTARRGRLMAEIAELRSRLDSAHERRQAYLQALELWQQARDTIVGSAEAPGSIMGIEAALTALAELPVELARLYEQRRDIARDIHRHLLRIADLYRTTYLPVQRFIADHAIAREIFNLRFEVAVVDAGFEDRLWDWINRGRIGSFLGQTEGAARVGRLLAESDFNEPNRAVDFVEIVVDHLRHDCRTEARTTVRIADQLRNNRSEESLLDFLYGFEYLESRFGLRMGERELHQLSPGEKGALLLVFYLLVDRSEAPLLIDQPEENLDNQTVVSLLVPSIKDAKQRRQIFIVTHNPNLAVVCGADQVICAERALGVQPRLSYCCGAVENPVINRKVVDVLEGTKRAFDFRGASYFDQAETIARAGAGMAQTSGGRAGGNSTTAPARVEGQPLRPLDGSPQTITAASGE